MPCARDNRPLTDREFWERVGQTLFVSATPSAYELKESQQVVEQIIRPTGLLDPIIGVRPTQHQVDDLLDEIRQRVDKHERVLITTLTKRMAEDLTDYFRNNGVRVQYLHSDIKSLERISILRDLRLGEFDVLIGVNLLREGLDLPEVSLVAIMDADKEGFLRSTSALIQTIGRAARNDCGQVILYADKITDAMAQAISETDRRRDIQTAYNTAHGITPKTIIKEMGNNLLDLVGLMAQADTDYKDTLVEEAKAVDPNQLPGLIDELEVQMKQSAKMLDFEAAAQLRDQMLAMKGLLPSTSP
jgi:excinuclease ABC subunit B